LPPWVPEDDEEVVSIASSGARGDLGAILGGWLSVIFSAVVASYALTAPNEK
jgi:hypothetical protein